MTKNILSQYCDLREEHKDINKRIQRLRDKLKKIENEGNVTDIVSCGRRGKKTLRNIKITGFPHPEYKRTQTAIIKNMAMLEKNEAELDNAINQIEEYISSIQESRIRRILRFRYLDGLTWIQVAVNMKGNSTADSVRMEHDRFLIGK